MMPELEMRTLEDCEIRAEDGETPKIVGYAAKFNVWSHNLGSFKERMLPGVFKRSLDAGDDVIANVDHDNTRIIGRRSSGTLEVSEDKTGLRIAIDPANTSHGRDIVESIRRGDVSEMSFAFQVVEEEYKRGANGKPDERTLKDVSLMDVCPVSGNAAYPRTKVDVRSWEAWKAENRDVTSEVTNVTSEVASAEVELDHMNAELDLLDATGSVV